MAQMDAAKKKELMEFLQDPEVQKQLGQGKDLDLKKKELLKPVEVSDDMDISDVAKAYQAKMLQMMEYMDDRISTAKEEAVATASAPNQKAEQAKIDKFLADHPELETNKKLLDLTSKLYGADEELEDAYAMARFRLDLPAETANNETVEDDKDTKEGDSKEAKQEPGKTLISSFKSTQTPTETDVAAETKEEPQTLKEIISANMNEAKAKLEID